MIVLILSSSWLYDDNLDDNHYYFEQYVYLWLDLTWLLLSLVEIYLIKLYLTVSYLFCFALFFSALLHFIVCNITLLLHWSVQYFIRIHDMTWHDITTFFMMIEFVLISCNFFRSTSFHVYDTILWCVWWYDMCVSVYETTHMYHK